MNDLIEDMQACTYPFRFSLNEITVPGNIWIGENVRFTPPAHAKLLQDLLGNSTLNLIPGYGHWSLTISL